MFVHAASGAHALLLAGVLLASQPDSAPAGNPAPLLPHTGQLFLTSHEVRDGLSGDSLSLQSEFNRGRTLLNGCHSAWCLPTCPRCVVASTGTEGHCKQGGQLYRCRVNWDSGDTLEWMSDDGNWKSFSYSHVFYEVPQRFEEDHPGGEDVPEDPDQRAWPDESTSGSNVQEDSLEEGGDEDDAHSSYAVITLPDWTYENDFPFQNNQMVRPLGEVYIKVQVRPALDGKEIPIVQHGSNQYQVLYDESGEQYFRGDNGNECKLKWNEAGDLFCSQPESTHHRVSSVAGRGPFPSRQNRWMFRILIVYGVIEID